MIATDKENLSSLQARGNTKFLKDLTYVIVDRPMPQIHDRCNVRVRFSVSDPIENFQLPAAEQSHANRLIGRDAGAET